MILIKEVAPHLETRLKVEEFKNENELHGIIVYSDEFQVVTEISELN